MYNTNIYKILNILRYLKIFLIQGMTDVLEEDLAAWIQANGGWVRQ